MELEYDSIDKNQLISVIHFLEKSGEKSKKENQDLKNMVKELRDTLNRMLRPRQTC